MHPFDPICALPAARFLAPATLEDRLHLAQQVAGCRLQSHDAANAWLAWVAQNAPEAGAQGVERLVRECLLMSPNHPQAEALYEALMRQPQPAPAAHGVVFMVTSCVKYLDQARRLQAALQQRGATACIVVGDAGAATARWDGALCTLPVADTYEALPAKVAAGVHELLRHHGDVAVVKIDDDCELTAAFDPARFAALAARHDYTGLALENPWHSRFWHLGKTSRPQGPYTRRYHGPWAGGACYLLSPRAAGLVSREWALHPAEIADEFYEDKAIGDFLRRQGITVQGIQHAQWGIQFELIDRLAGAPAAAAPIVAPIAPAAPAPAALPVTNHVTTTTTSGPQIPKLLHIVWLGEDAARPDNLIASWIAHHPGWTVQVWGNDDLGDGPWQCTEQLLALGADSVPAMARLMQWEVLWRVGGVAVAADSLCIRTLDESLLQHERFCAALSESAAPGLLCGAYFGCAPGDALVGALLDHVAGTPDIGRLEPSAACGDLLLTALAQARPDLPLQVLPSHAFLPMHPDADPHVGTAGVYAVELWASHLGLVDAVASWPIDELRRTLGLAVDHQPRAFSAMQAA